MRNVVIISILTMFAALFYRNHAAYSQNSQDELNEAYELGKQGKIDQAVEKYLAYYQNNPQRHEILQNIAELYEKDKRYDEAIDYMEKLIVKDAEFLFRGAHFKDQCDRLMGVWDKAGAKNILNVLGKAKGIELAKEHYTEKINNKDTTSRMKAVSQIMLGDIADKSKDIDKAREHYYRAFEQIESASDDWEKTVNRVLQRKFMDKRWYDDVITVYKSYPDYSNLIQLGQWLKQQGRGYEMIDLYENYLLHGRQEKEKNDIFQEYEILDLSENIIDELVSVKRGQSLTGQFNDLIASEPKNSELHKKFAYMLIKIQRTEEGLCEIEIFLSSKEKSSASDYEWAGDLCEKAKLVDNSIEYYEAARDTEITDAEVRRALMMSQMAASPGYWKQRYKAQILEKLGNLYIKQKQWSNAESCFNEIVEQEENRYKEDAQKKLAQIWEQMGKENTFIENTEKKLTQEPQNVEVRVDYARTLLNSNKTEEAVKQYEKAVEMTPDDISLRLKLADALAEHKQNEKAIDEYKTALFMAAKKNENEFIHSKGGDETEPRFILNKLSRFCEKADKKEKLLDIYIDILVMLDSPDIKWVPDEYVIKNILRDMTEIYEAKGKYSAAIELWLGYRKEMTYYARSVIQDQLEFAENLEPFINQLKKETSEEPVDYWGNFILADMLYTENKKDEALEIYTELLNKTTADSRLHHDLTEVFQHMKRYDLMLDASMKALGQYSQGGRDYGRALGNIADIYVRLDNKEKAAEFYRKAITCDISQEEYEQFRKALSNITGETEVQQHIESVTIKPMVDLEKMRFQAEQKYSGEDYKGAAEMYKQILEIAPTDLESMVHLGESYYSLDNISEATDLFEKVVLDEDMRVWANSPDSYYGAASNLGGIYRQNNDIKNMIKLYALSDWQELIYVQKNLKSNDEKEQFHKYLMEQSQQTPDSLKLNFYLVLYFSEREEKAQAEKIAEKLYKELSNENGQVPDRNNAIELAKSYESLGQFQKALTVLSSFDYENDNDVSFDRLGEILVRLYSKANQFDKAFDICVLRLEKDPKGYKTKEIAEQIAEVALLSDDGTQLLTGFFDKIKDEMPESNYRRFRGAALSYIEAHPELSRNVPSASSETALLILLKQGRIVETPQDCRSFAEFLEKLASQADTLATQSFMSRYGRQMQAPRINIKRGSAFEILAQALDGTAIPMEMTQEGYWALFEAGDTSRKISYAASGGLLWSFEGFYRGEDEHSIRLQGKILSNPSLVREIVSIQSEFMITNAIDNKGKRAQIAQSAKMRHLVNQIQLTFNETESIIKMIKELQIKTNVAICTKWSTFTINQLDYDKPISLEDESMTIEIEPIKETIRELKREWDINMTVQSKDIVSNKEPAELKYEMFFITGEEKKPIYTIGGIYKYKDMSKLRIHSEDNSLNPSTTSLLIRFPAEIEIVPFKLTFNNIPAIQR